MLKYVMFPFVMIYMTIICPIMCLLNVFNQTKKDLLFRLSYYVNLLFNVNIIRVSTTDIVRKHNIIYLTNHRSFADMFIDPMICGYCGMFIARNLVGLVFPFTFIISKITNNCIFINRDNIGNIEKFFQNVEETRKKYTHLNIVVYPEGTRRPNAYLPCPLKKGFIYHSYNENLPLQIYISKGKETVINETKINFGLGKKVYVSFSDIITPDNNSETIEEYYARVQHIWNSVWMSVFTQNTDFKSYPFNQNAIYKNKIRKTNKLYLCFKLTIYFIWIVLSTLFLFSIWYL